MKTKAILGTVVVAAGIASFVVWRWLWLQAGTHRTDHGEEERIAGHIRSLSNPGLAVEEWDTRLALRACDGPRNQEVHFRGYTEPEGGARPVLEWQMTAAADQVLPLPGNVAEVSECRIWTRHDGDGVPGPTAVLLVGASRFSWAAPAPKNAFIQLGGSTILDHDVRAWAIFEPAEAEHDGGATPAVTVITERTAEPAAVHDHLRAGDSFAWGRHRATVVRVVEPYAPYIGWVEVSLSDPG